MKKIILLIFITLAIISFPATQNEIENDKKIIKSQTEFIIELFKSDSLNNYLKSYMNLQNDDGSLTKEDIEKLSDFYSDYINSNKYEIKDVKITGKKATVYMSISIIDIDKYSSEIIGDIKKLATQKKTSDKRNSDEFSSEEFVKIFSTISKKTNAKRKTKDLKIGFEKIDSDWEMEDKGFDEMFNLQEFSQKTDVIITKAQNEIKSFFSKWFIRKIKYYEKDNFGNIFVPVSNNIFIIARRKFTQRQWFFQSFWKFRNFIEISKSTLTKRAVKNRKTILNTTLFILNLRNFLRKHR